MNRIVGEQIIFGLGLNIKGNASSSRGAWSQGAARFNKLFAGSHSKPETFLNAENRCSAEKIRGPSCFFGWSGRKRKSLFTYELHSQR